MEVQQAIFTSLRKSYVQGYHLAARSAGIDETLARLLTQWGPSHNELMDRHPDTSSLNFHPAGDNWFVLSRTVFGAPEYSGRGGLQIITFMLILQSDQFAMLDCHPLAILRAARAEGWLRYSGRFPSRLPTLMLPDRSIRRRSQTVVLTPHDEQTAAQAVSMLDQGRQIALIGLDDSEATLTALFDRSQPDARSEFSFTTRLKPSLRRAFRLHCLPDTAEPATAERLKSLGIHSIMV